VRLFFSELYRPPPETMWHRAYPDGEFDKEREDMMALRWLTATQHELGCPVDIRYPTTHAFPFTTTDAGFGTDEPPNESSTAQQSDEEQYSMIASQECIEWEMAFNIQILRRLQRIRERLAKRIRRGRSKQVMFLRGLEKATGAWLGEVEEQARASERNLSIKSLGKQRFGWTMSMRLEGKMVCVALVKNIR
jgi:hypothetical protein